MHAGNIFLSKSDIHGDAHLGDYVPRIVTPGPISGYVSYGHPDSSSLYINEVEYSSWESFKFIKKLNQMGSFEIRLAGIESSDRTNIAEGKEVKIFNEYFLIFKGRIERVEYEQDFYVSVKGFGMEYDLTNYEVTREEYVSTNTTTIVKELLSENMDGSSPWIVNEGVNTDWGDITLKGEYDNRLKYLSNLAETVGFDWWVSQDIAGNEELNTGLYSTANDYFHIDTRKGSSTSVKTFYTGGDNQNATIVNREVDKENMTNYINVLGYAEGINQVTASFYNASTVTTTLNETLTTTDVTITLLDASNFSTSGTVRIESELVKYTGKSSNNLTGCTRASSQATSKAHPIGIFVEKHFTLADAEVGSSIGDNGVIQRTFDRRDLISQQAAQCLASELLFALKDPIVRIFLKIDDVRFTGVEVGDNVTIVDTDLSLNTVYRVVGIERGSTMEEGEYLILECSNQSVSVMEDLADTTRRSDVETKYAMGTMTAENLSEKENIDATHDLDMLFYLPSDVIRINKALLSFKLKNYRAYETGLAGGGSSTPTSGGGSVHSHTVSNHTHSVSGGTTGSTNHQHAIGTWVSDTPGGYSTKKMACVDFNDNNVYFDLVIDNSVGYDDPLIYTVGTGAHSHGISASTSGDGGGQTSSAESSHNHTVTIPTHIHAVTFGIYEETLSGPLCTVSIGLEGAEVQATYTTIDIDSYDITSILSSAYIANGGNKWYNVNFAGSKNMRIEANVFLKYFIESKS